MIVQDSPGSECEHCQGTGWVIRDVVDRFGRENNIASPCRHCGAGRAVKKACTIKDKQAGKRRALRKAQVVIKEVVDSLPDSPPPNKDLF